MRGGGDDFYHFFQKSVVFSPILIRREISIFFLKAGLDTMLIIVEKDLPGDELPIYGIFIYIYTKKLYLFMTDF